MISDFSTTTSVHRIVSQITLMTSVQEFFDYWIGTACGIPAIEMKGTLEDWMKLKEKIISLWKTLTPILSEIGLASTYYYYDDYDDIVDYHSDYVIGDDDFYDHYDEISWWQKLIYIADKLIDTFNGNPDEDFWSRIVSEEK